MLLFIQNFFLKKYYRHIKAWITFSYQYHTYHGSGYQREQYFQNQNIPFKQFNLMIILMHIAPTSATAVPEYQFIANRNEIEAIGANIEFLSIPTKSLNCFWKKKMRVIGMKHCKIRQKWYIIKWQCTLHIGNSIKRN